MAEPRILDMSAAGIRAALKPTDELSSLSSHAKPVALWGSARRISFASEQDHYRERYRDAEWVRIGEISRGLHMLSRAGMTTGAWLARGMTQFAAAIQRT